MNLWEALDAPHLKPSLLLPANTGCREVVPDDPEANAPMKYVAAQVDAEKAQHASSSCLSQ
jgi:hypothetical protein